MSNSEVSAETILNIQNTLANYCIALDDQNFQLLRKVFTPDTVANYGAVTGGNDDIRGVDSIITKVEEVLKNLRTQHALSTQRITFREDGSCDVRTYFQAHTFSDNPETGLRHTTFFGYYDDNLKEVGTQTWRILERKVKVHVSDVSNSLMGTQLTDCRTKHPRIKNNSTV